MRSRRTSFFAVILLAAIPGVAAAQSSGQPSTVDQVVDRIVAQEKAEMQMLRQYSPLVETYIQLLRPDQTLGSAPAGDKYYLGKANLAKGLDLQPLTSDKGAPNLKYTAGGLGTFLTMSMQFLPRGFLQMIYIDTNGFDVNHLQKATGQELHGHGQKSSEAAGRVLEIGSTLIAGERLEIKPLREIGFAQIILVSGRRGAKGLIRPEKLDIRLDKRRILAQHLHLRFFLRHDPINHLIHRRWLSGGLRGRHTRNGRE